MADTASLAYCFTTYPPPMTVKRLSCDFLIFPWDIDGAEAVGCLLRLPHPHQGHDREARAAAAGVSAARASQRFALADSSTGRLPPRTAPHGAPALGAGMLVRLDAVLANGARARRTACGALLFVR